MGRKDDQNNMVFTPAEIEYISKRYWSLFGNRLDHLQQGRKNAYFMKSIQKNKFDN